MLQEAETINDADSDKKIKILKSAATKIGEGAFLFITGIFASLLSIPAGVFNIITLIYSVPRLFLIFLQTIAYYMYLKIGNRGAEVLRDEKLKNRIKEFVKRRLQFVVDAHEGATEAGYEIFESY